MNEVSMVIERVPLSPNKILGRHWSFKYSDKQDWRNRIFVAQPKWVRDQFRGKRPATVEFNVVFPKRQLDPDNLIASLKPVIDSLKACGYIWNDSHDWLELKATQDIVSRAKGMPRTEIRVVML